MSVRERAQTLVAGLPRGLDDERLAPLARVIRHPLTAIVAIFLVSRLAVLLVGALALDRIAGEPVTARGLLCHFDCGWYLRIADEGYSTTSLWQPGATLYAFFPLFPLSVRLVGLIPGLSTLDAGLLASNGFFLIALVYIYAYARLLGMSVAIGLMAIAMLSFAPQSFVFSAAYSESLFLLLLAAAMYHMRREQFVASGIAAALLSAARPNGVLFAVFPIAWGLRRYGLELLVRPWRRPEVLLPAALAPLGLFAYWGFSLATTGDAFAHMTTSAYGWGFGFASPIDNIVGFIHGGTLPRFWLAASVVGFAASLLLLRYRLYEEFVLCAAMFALWWSNQIPYSYLRYTITLFPIWIVVSRATDGRPVVQATLIGAMSLLGGLLMVAWTLSNNIAI